ncbi:MAG: hypothetical protein PWP51_1590 [Clostridiales bacterium]|jgi:hypothetical protein|nr:hypothetical protein [Clostridiales bacterium]MDN5299037.1 hypothetical protein [Clostridiales bacterium]
MKTKRVIIVLILCIAVLFNPVYAKPVLTQDEAVVSIAAVNFRVVFDIIDDLEKDLVENDRYRQLSQDAITEILRDASNRCFDIETSFESLAKIRPQFKISIFSMVNYLDSLWDKTDRGEMLSAKDIESIHALYELKKANSSLRLRTLYQVDRNPFTALKVPETVNTFLKAVTALRATEREQAASEQAALVSRNTSLEETGALLQTELLKTDLPLLWQKTWDDIGQADGALTNAQIEAVNFLFQPVLDVDDWSQVNPLSCFFTSYYASVSDINFADFLRYFPYEDALEDDKGIRNGGSLASFPEYELLKNNANWPFVTDDIPVPIHRYKREVIDEILTAYANITVNDLSGIGFDEIIYLEHTDAYYNFTSDFGPGTFHCLKGTVSSGVITLNSSTSDDGAVLTIEKVNDRYVIKSFIKA